MSDIGSGIATVSKPTEWRRWLQPQVSKQQILRLEPRSKPEALSAADYWERTRRAIRAWWIWLAALLLYGAGLVFGRDRGCDRFRLLSHNRPIAFDDLYKHDAALEEFLDKGYPYSAWKPTPSGPGRGRRE